MFKKNLEALSAKNPKLAEKLEQISIFEVKENIEVYEAESKDLIIAYQGLALDDIYNPIRVAKTNWKTNAPENLSPYDIVLTSRGTLGNVALYDKHIKYENIRINSGMLIIRPKTKRLSPYFIYALLKSSYMKAAIERFKSGSAQPQLPIKDLQKITFEIPQSDDILATLDHQFVSIEERISFNNKEIDNLKELSAVLLAELSR